MITKISHPTPSYAIEPDPVAAKSELLSKIAEVASQSIGIGRKNHHLKCLSVQLTERGWVDETIEVINNHLTSPFALSAVRDCIFILAKRNDFDQIQKFTAIRSDLVKMDKALESASLFLLADGHKAALPSLIAMINSPTKKIALTLLQSE